MNKYVKMFMFLAIASLAFVATDASAQNVFSVVISRLTATFQNVRTVVFVLGGFGLIGMGFSAILGKIKWGWVAALAAGLAVVALAGAAVDYVTEDTANTAYTGDYDLGNTLLGD